MLSSSVLQALAKSDLFSGCEPDRVGCREQSFEQGARIPAKLEQEPAVGLVTRGKVLVYSEGPDRRAIGLSALGVGESFGISNIFTGENLTTVLVSGGQTAVAYISKRCFVELLEQTPGMMLRYATLCNRKLRYLTEKIEFFSIPSSRARLAAWLLGNSVDGVVRLDRPREEIAGMLGVSRASLFRELRWLSDAGMILVSRRAITLRNPRALRRCVEKAS